MKMQVSQTTFRDNRKNRLEQYFDMLPDLGVENNTINLYPEETDQTMLGFGGALTDSSGYVYSMMNDKQKEELIAAYFGEDNMNYSTVRIHIDSCDFSLEHYEAMSNKDDITMESFSLERPLKYIGLLLNDVLKVRNAPLEIMVTPWSPPAFMKTNKQRNNGGKLLPEYKMFWAQYLCKYIIELRKLGYLVTAMSIQNEPKAIQTWDSCVFTAAEEKEFLKDYLYPALLENGLGNVGVYIWDHNKERVYERALEVIDEDTDKMVKGVAFHWYSGDHFEALKLVHKRFPEKVLALSEACIEYCKYSSLDYLANAQKYAHDMIGNLNSGMQLFYDWNILLDELGGPNHVENYCDAPYLFDTKEKKLVARNTLSYVWHFSHFIKPGAVRIEVSRYTQDIEATAFLNLDKTIALVLLNRTKEQFEATIRLNGMNTTILIQPESILTGVIEGMGEKNE